MIDDPTKYLTEGKTTLYIAQSIKEVVDENCQNFETVPACMAFLPVYNNLSDASRENPDCEIITVTIESVVIQ